MTASRRQLRAGAVEELGPFLAGLAPWDLFGGLTFDQRRCRHERVWGLAGGRCPRVIPIDSAKLRFEGFVRSAEAALQRRVDYVAAIEAHKNGWPHLHPLFAFEGGLMEGDVETLGRLWYKRNGYGRLEVPRSQQDVTGYCAKYLTKDLAIGTLLISARLGGSGGS